MSNRPPPGQTPRRTGPPGQAPRATPGTRPPAPPAPPPAAPRRTTTRTTTSARSSTPARVPARRTPPPSRNDRLPLILGGLVGALLIALLAVVFITSNQTVTPPVVATTGAVAQPTTPLQPGATAPAGEPPPRMSLETFKALYDDPAKRPIIIDVRASAAYGEGHILGSISFPESDVDTRFKELPKDKLVVAYCQ